jgi:DNA-binding CsgD family transcriptional regulator/tetratricopeptide (TPR) repeat protein
VDGTIQGPVTCPVLVGREAHLDAFAGALGRAVAGKGGTVVVAGEAGVGKSRLVSEVRSRAAAEGLAVVEGSCLETQRSLPYGPIVDLLHGWLTSQPPELVLAHVQDAAEELLPLLPELATLVPGAISATTLDPATQQRRLFDAIARVIGRAAAGRPLLLVIEDLHWGDESSLDFVCYLAKRILSQPILAILTFRSDEVHTGLQRTLARLDRERLAAELRLEPLTVPQIDTMLRATLGLRRPTRREFVETVHALTEGNPFFIEELMKALILDGHVLGADVLWKRAPTDGLPIPRTVEDAVQRRTAQLSAGAREVLDLAAVAGRRFDFTVLADVLGRDEPELLGQMKELVAAQLVVEESADRFAFRHALTREAVYNGMLGRERGGLHRVVAEATERQYPGTLDARSAELAWHFFAAGAWARAGAYARRAGEAAQALFTPGSAVEMYTIALRASEHESPGTEAELHQLRGRASATLGAFEAARADFEAALALARGRGDRRVEWRTLLDTGALWSERDYDRMGELLDEALGLARQLGDPVSVAASLNALGNWYTNKEEPEAAVGRHHEALGIFERLDDRSGISETLGLLGGAFLFAGDGPRSAESYERAIVLRTAMDDRPGLASVLSGRTLCAAGSGTDTMVPAALTLADAVRDGEKSLELARDLSWPSGEVFALMCLGVSLGSLGEYAGAFARVTEASEIAQAIEHREWLAGAAHAMGELLLSVVALVPARHCVEQSLRLAQEIRSPFWISQATGRLAEIHVASGEAGRARELLEALPPATRSNSPGRRLCSRVRAELALAGGHADEALRLVDQLIGSTHTVVPRLRLLRAGALAALDRMAEAESELLRARGTALGQGARPLVWRCDAALGRLYRSQGRRDDADRAWEMAGALVHELAPGIPDSSVRQGFLEATVAGWPQRRSLTPRRARQRANDGLTDREREVADLVARGLSNRQVAEALVLSPATVETHVKHILGKLGFTSRAQVAHWAAQKGIVHS